MTTTHTKRARWSSRTTFILAAVGSAVGLGNAWRFPGLIAKHGGGSFLFVYLFAMLIMGMPLLMMEIAIGRKFRRGTPGSLRGINKKTEFVGWAATTNAFVITIYYAVVFAWVLLMVGNSYKFSGMTGAETGAADAQSLWYNIIKATGTFDGFSTISWPVVIALIVAWTLIYICIKDGAHSVGKVVKYTVFIPVVILIVFAIKGITMPGAFGGLEALFVPDFDQLKSVQLWVDAIGQVFFSLSIMMAIMFAYGSFLDSDSNIAVDGIIIAFSDMAVSVLAGIVIFTTMYGTNMTVDNMSSSGIATAFIIYPTAIINLTNIGWVNAIFGCLFYLCLVTLAIDSAFSIVEGVSTAISDKFNISHQKSTIGVCVTSGLLSLLFVTGAGLAVLDVVDNWTNQFNMIIIGVLECIAIGWCFKPNKVLKEINMNTNKFKMPAWWFISSVKFISPVFLTALLGWNVYTLFTSGGVYGAADGYTLASNIIFGWIISIIVFISGPIVNLVFKIKVKKDPSLKCIEDLQWSDEN